MHIWFHCSYVIPTMLPEGGCSLRLKNVGIVKPILQLVGKKLVYINSYRGHPVVYYYTIITIINTTYYYSVCINKYNSCVDGYVIVITVYIKLLLFSICTF